MSFLPDSKQMYYNFPAPAALYRVTDPGTVWPTPVIGFGAYYTQGGRYNDAQAKTVYCSEDPLVALTEAAYYQAKHWQRSIAASPIVALNYPLSSRHILWRFTIDPAPPVIDFLNPAAVHAFPHSPQVLLNPGSDYSGTRAIANQVRGHAPIGLPRPQGLRAPSIRTPRIGVFQPSQFALFVMDPAFQQQFEVRSNLVEQWEVDLEFRTQPPRQAVTYATDCIDWVKPRLRVTGAGKPPVPALPGRPGGQPIPIGGWRHLLTINYGQC